MTKTADLKCTCTHFRSEHPRNGACVRVNCRCKKFVMYYEEEEPEDELDESMEAIISSIERGALDPYIELLLHALHERKLTLRNVRGFPRRRR